MHDEEELIRTITTSYHHHNPNKPENIETINHNSLETKTDIYTYDKYDRKICIDTVYVDDEKITEERTKTTYEYDELIKA